jgi:cell division protease FtsH
MENQPDESPRLPKKPSAPSPQNPPDRPPQTALARSRFNGSTLFLLVVLATILMLVFSRGSGESRAEVQYGVFWEQVKKKNVESIHVNGSRIQGKFREPVTLADGKVEDGKPQPLPLDFTTTISPFAVGDPSFEDTVRKSVGSNYDVSEPKDNTMFLLLTNVLVGVLLIAVVWFMFKRMRDQVLTGGGMLSGFSKSPAKRYQTDKPVTFNDVAGLEGVKQELEEVVLFLKSPEKFQRLGGRIPKGVLLMGPPGTGKTLLGRAVAGEAGVPFFSISGSEFIQMFVGVGASRVRDMFNTAKENAPSILFIDEIDAVGRHRGAGLGGGHDEREQTLNQILSEMDGFTQNESVIVMAATNRPDVLDPALLRPGRFDRHVTVDRPNLKGRLAIFKVYCREVPLADDVDFERLAAGTVGLTGADIRNLVNEAAIWATKQEKDSVGRADFEYARDRILMGSKREEVLIGKEKSMTAYHEAGHALVAWLVPSSDRVHKISIIPRGRSLGATQILPEEDRVSISETELHSRLAFLLGGRAAEKVVFNELGAGAEDDLKRATQIARRMVTHWGMSDRVGPVAFRATEDQPFLGKEMTEPREFSEHTARLIDEEIVRIIRAAASRAEELLIEHRDKLNALAKALETEEVLDEPQIAELIGPAATISNGTNHGGESL